jgi:hypothetical protein
VKNSGILSKVCTQLKNLLPKATITEENGKQKLLESLEMDWWSKFYASDKTTDLGDERVKVTLKVSLILNLIMVSI